MDMFDMFSVHDNIISFLLSFFVRSSQDRLGLLP